jgi:hypothetical protein
MIQMLPWQDQDADCKRANTAQIRRKMGPGKLMKASEGRWKSLGREAEPLLPREAKGGNHDTIGPLRNLKDSEGS